MKNNTATKVFRALCGMVVMLAFLASITSVSVSAASNGIYIATATPHYKHPQTGVIEDSGGNGSAVLGQSMTESATYKKALVEVDSAGNTYITIRLQLMDNIQNPQFSVDGSPVSASLMQEDFTNNTADYRMRVNNENSIIRCNMYVTAMGRDVIFYITVSNLSSGSGDFITSVTVEAPQQGNNNTMNNTPNNASNNQQYNNPAPAESQVYPAEAESKVNTEATEKPTEKATEKPTEKATEKPTEKTTETEKNTDATEVLGIQEFEAAEKSSSALSKESDDSNQNDKSDLGWIIAVIIIVVAAAGICVLCFFLYKKKKRGVNDES